MAITLTHDAQNGILILEVSGELRIEEFKQAARDVVLNEKFPSNISALWDLRQADMQNLDEHFMRDLINLRKNISSQRGVAKIALLVSSDLQYGMSRRYSVLTESLPQTIRIFKDFENAVVWLLEDMQVSTDYQSN